MWHRFPFLCRQGIKETEVERFHWSWEIDNILKISVQELLPHYEKKSQIQQLWEGFLEIYNTITLDEISNDAVMSLKARIKKWMVLFKSVYQTKHVTPYMHALMHHVPEFIRLHGSLVKFNQQGLEKLNQNQTKDFYRATNFRRQEAVFMLLQKWNRLKEVEDEGYKRQKQVQFCSNCKEANHNMITCTKPSALLSISQKSIRNGSQIVRLTNKLCNKDLGYYILNKFNYFSSKHFL